jgi:hypothetical protein
MHLLKLATITETVELHVLRWFGHVQKWKIIETPEEKYV